MGKKKDAERAAAAVLAAREAELEAARAAEAAWVAERAADQARREAEVEPVGDTMTKAERKAAKKLRAAMETAAADGAQRGDTITFGADYVPSKAARKAVKRARAEAALAALPQVESTGETVTAARIPDRSELEQLAAAMDPDLPTSPPPAPLPEPTDPGVVVGQLVAPAAVEPAGVEPVERDQWGRPVVEMPDSTRRGYRRVTTFIDVLEDKSNLEDYGKRMVLEGLSLDYQIVRGAGASDPSLINRVGDALDRRDAALAELALATAEAEVLAPGPKRATIERDHKRAIKALAEEAATRAGANDKATKGTDLHALTELVDQGLPLPDSATEADRRDLAAYAEAVKAAGIVFTERERFVVLDDLQVGGTLDRAGLFRFPGTARARRCVMDIKTGRIDYSPGKIAMQLATYAHGLAYDRDTRQRTDLKLDKTRALLIHLPAGEGRCSIIAVDIEAAWKDAVRLADQVYAWRTEGKRAFDASNPLVTIDLAATAA